MLQMKNIALNKVLNMTSAYIIGQITVKDEEKWAKYRSQVPATLEPWGGELVFRGKLSDVLSGSHQHSDTVVIRFPSLQHLNDWHGSARGARNPAPR